MTMSNSTAGVPQVDRIAEANHRIANELGQLAILAKRQIEATMRGPESLSRQAVVELLRLHHSRLLGIARLHHAISRHPDTDRVDLAEMLADVVREFEASGVFEQRLHLTASLANQCLVDAGQASAVALAFSEILINALRYAHPTGLPVEMTVAVATAADGTVALDIADDGVGLPEDFVESRDAGVGMKLMRGLVEGAGGKIAMSSSALGLAIHIELPGRAHAAKRHASDGHLPDPRKAA